MKQAKTKTPTQINSLAKDNLHESDPEFYRNYMLKVGGTEEDAEAYAQWVAKNNERIAALRRENEADTQDEETLAHAS